MTRSEMRSFRRAARNAGRQAVKDGTITRLQRGRFLLKLRDDEFAEELADTCLAQAVECKVLTETDAATGEVDWVGIGENIDWKKLGEWIKEVIQMFLG